MFVYRNIYENLTNAGLPLMKGEKSKKAYSKAELTKHGLMLTTFVFFFGFTKLGLLNKLFFSARKSHLHPLILSYSRVSRHHVRP